MTTQDCGGHLVTGLGGRHGRPICCSRNSYRWKDLFVRLHRGVVRLPCLRTPHALLLAMSWCLLFGVAVSSLLAAFRSLARKTCCRRNWRRTSLQGVALVGGTTKMLVSATNWTLFPRGDSRTLIFWCCCRAVWSLLGGAGYRWFGVFDAPGPHAAPPGPRLARGHWWAVWWAWRPSGRPGPAAGAADMGGRQVRYRGGLVLGTKCAVTVAVRGLWCSLAGLRQSSWTPEAGGLQWCSCRRR